MDEAKSQPWYQLYGAAVVELDPKLLIDRVDATEAAIQGRLRDLQYDSDHHEERQLMADAQRNPGVLASLSLRDPALLQPKRETRHSNINQSNRRHLWRSILPNR